MLRSIVRTFATSATRHTDLATFVHGGAATSSEITRLWRVSRAEPDSLRTFYGVDGADTAVAVGIKDTSSAEIQKAAERAARELKAQGSRDFAVETAGSPHAAAVGATLGVFDWNMKSSEAGRKLLEAVTIREGGPRAGPAVAATGEKASSAAAVATTFETGATYGAAQNLARELMELPSNICTPTYFCERAAAEFAGLPNVELFVRDEAWIKEKRMGAFLAVAKGSAEPPRFLEVHYRGGPAGEPPVALVGKGVTFDSGGISLKPGDHMKEMRADMGGAATTLAATAAVARLRVPVNVVLCIPLTENMPGPTASKPGDIVTASNGVTIEIDNTDAEGRLILADALVHACSFKPRTVIDAATLTGAMMIALGDVYTGAFCNDDALWDALDTAGSAENEPLWRMPLHPAYNKMIDHTGMDITNSGGRPGGACTAAIFLSHFVPEGVPWAHLDIAGVMSGGTPERMTGRPTRALIEYVRRVGGAGSE